MQNHFLNTFLRSPILKQYTNNEILPCGPVKILLSQSFTALRPFVEQSRTWPSHLSMASEHPGNYPPTAWYFPEPYILEPIPQSSEASCSKTNYYRSDKDPEILTVITTLESPSCTSQSLVSCCPKTCQNLCWESRIGQNHVGTIVWGLPLNQTLHEHSEWGFLGNCAPTVPRHPPSPPPISPNAKHPVLSMERQERQGSTDRILNTTIQLGLHERKQKERVKDGSEEKWGKQ